MLAAHLKWCLGRWHEYAWTLPEVDFAFFNLRTDSAVPVEEIVTQSILFRVGVHKSAWNNGGWICVGQIDPPARSFRGDSKQVVGIVGVASQPQNQAARLRLSFWHQSTSVFVVLVLSETVLLLVLETRLLNEPVFDHD